jgi:hypothetical protein
LRRANAAQGDGGLPPYSHLGIAERLLKGRDCRLGVGTDGSQGMCRRHADVAVFVA